MAYGFNIRNMRATRGIAQAIAATFLATLLLAGGALFLPTSFAERAEATDTVYVASPNGPESPTEKTEIEIVTDAYEKARAVALASDVRAAASAIRLGILDARIPQQQERSDNAVRELYKLQQDRTGVMDLLLQSSSLEDFIQRTEYLESISRANVRTIIDLKEAKARQEAVKAQLDSARAESDAAMNMAKETLNAAKIARSAKQSQAQQADGALEDGADWSMSKDEFIAAWAPRIDAYLAGSPLEGQGATFARASWRYCVDPRWSPAISNTESSKGAVCIRPHNAWGWGAADSDPSGLASQWDSWEEAIDAHVRGLAKGYGYTISKAAAEKYCSSPDSWYEGTANEMKKI